MFHLKCHSDFSLLKSSAQIKYIKKRINELGMGGCALTDYGSISGGVNFIDSMQKDGLKPIVGCQLYLKDTSNFTVIAKNLEDWRRLIKLVSHSNHPDVILKDYNIPKPVVTLEEAASFSEQSLICYTGYLGSDFFNDIFTDAKKAVLASNYDEAKGLVSADWEQLCRKNIGRYKELFGADNVYLAVQTFTEKYCAALQIANKIIRHVAKKYGIKLTAVADPHYAGKNGAPDHRVLLSTKEGTTLKDLDKVATKQNDDYIYRFLQGNGFYIPSEEEMRQVHTDEEIAHTDEIVSRCEVYKVSRPPQVPKFECGDYTQEGYLRHLCREGWKKKINGRIPKGEQEKYIGRIKTELDVIMGASILPSYFLIVQDYCNWARSQGMKIGERGSGAGCLISYLINITNLDPIEHDLIFERFYNVGRNTKDKISLPDIDVDFPKYRRQDVINYIGNKWGWDKFSGMITFNGLKSRGATKEVLRAHGRCSNAEMNRITKKIPQEPDIADHLQTMKDARGYSSALLWALENTPKELAEWCEISPDSTDEELKLEGNYANDFLQAMRIEGCKKNPSTHASGYVLSVEPLASLCPLVYSEKDNTRVAGFEMGDLETLGIPKLDILGSLSLDKLMMIENLVRTGRP